MTTYTGVRPRRSALYMPASSERALEKARTLPADVLIFDLEDAVAPDMKQVARQNACQAVLSKAYGKREVLVRLNGLDTPWGHDDLKALARCGCDGLVIPKVNSPKVLLDVAAEMNGLVLPYPPPALWCMIETAQGVLNAPAIASASDRLAGLIMGTSDLARELGCAHTPDRLPFMTSFGVCILAARAANIAILDGVHLDLSDDAGFRKTARQGAEMGFDGKTLIHPKTIDDANRAFGPTPADIEQAREIVHLWEQAGGKDKGVIVHNNRLIESLHADQARRLLCLAKAIEEREAKSE